MEIREMVTELRQLLRTAPPAYQQWDHNAVVQYKKACAKAVALVNQGAPKKSQVEAALSEQRRFWGGAIQEAA